MEELETLFQQYIATSKYSRWLDEEGRREIWPEPPRRYVENVVRPVLTEAGFKKKEIEEVCEKAFDYIRKTLVLPSMRAMMTAGPALDRDHMAGYNCSYLAIEHPRAFDEALYILSCGTGLGFSVERQFISQLPDVAEEFHDTDTVIKVRDSKVGWATSLKETIGLLYNGQVPKFDVSAVRPAGARLKVFGGRASGPQPLVDLLNYCVRVFKGAAGRKLNSLEAHGIMCKIGEAIVVGGVRRCLPAGSLVHTRRGLVPIEDVVPGEDEALTSGGYKLIRDKFDQGQQATVKVLTQTGQLVCTPNHRVAVLTDVYGGYVWKEASELQENDRLLFSAVAIDGSYTVLPASTYEKPERAYTAKSISIPTLDVEMAWFLGYYHANGHSAIRYRSPGKRNSVVSVCVPNAAAGLAEVCKTQLERFGTNVRVGKGDGDCSIVKTASVALALWFQENMKESSQPFRVPDFILQGTAETRSAYLAGVMDGDGSVSSRPIQVMSCVHLGFLHDLQALCASLGFATRSHCNRPAQGNWKPLYRVLLKGTKQETQFYATVGKFLKYKQEAARTRSKEMFSYSFPAGMIQKTADSRHKTHYHQNHKVNCPIELWEELTETKYPFTPVAVLEREDYETLPTWDIEVDEYNEFYCNGYLVHNSALISLSNLTDQRMRNAKSGQWWESHPEYSLANNSVAYTEKPDTDAFMQEWLALYQSKSGERGIFNRDGAKRKMKRLGRRDPDHEWGGNPCLEILLRSLQTCNLTEVVVRPEDKIETLLEKVELATILGTIQSTFTTFRYLRPGWKRNIEEERLLGVSFTGIYDNKLTSGWGEEWNELDANQQCLKAKAIETNKIWAEKLGINPSTSVTCVKPAGTTSSLSNTASGIHPRHAPFYLRAVRQDNKDALTKLMKDQGIPNEPCVTRPESTTIFYFPMKAPDGATTKEDLTALNHLELWKKYNTNWAEHTVSVTVSVREHEWMEVGAWVYKHFDDITGISFLPFDQGTYKQAPFQAITKEEYEAAAAKMPASIDWSQLTKYEIEDETTGSRELACVGNVCEIA